MLGCRKAFSSASRIFELLRAILIDLLGRMTRNLLRSRRLMAVSILLLLAGLVVLSAATRKPCLQAGTASWHVWKSGYMAKAEGLKACQIQVTLEAVSAQSALEEPPSPAPATDLPRKEIIPPAIPLIAQVRHFRAPPALG
jgi:hypothetical protein